MRGLYAIVDVAILESRGIDLTKYAEALLRARPAALQLRAKERGSREILGILRVLAPMCRAARVALVANDRPDLAALAGCDIVHVGQSDLPIGLVRRIAPSLKVGVSTHNAAQLAAALEARPAYVAYGPVFATSSKADAEPTVGVADLARAFASARAKEIPLVAIGGIALENVSEVAPHCDAVAVIGALLPEPGVFDGEAADQVCRRALAITARLAGGASRQELPV